MDGARKRGDGERERERGLNREGVGAGSRKWGWGDGRRRKGGKGAEVLRRARDGCVDGEELGRIRREMEVRGGI